MEGKKISTREEVAERIAAKLAETSNAQTGEVLAKGTAIEEAMTAAEIPVPDPGEKRIDEKKIPLKEKRGRGRPVGSYKTKKVTKEKKKDGTTTETISETEHESPPVEKSDFIATIVNNALLPIAAHFLKKNVDDLKITDPQSKENVKYMPEDVVIKPSWGAYIGMSILCVAGNVMAAPARNKETEDLAEMKKALIKSLEVEELKKTIAEMQISLEKIHGNMRVVRPGDNGHYTEEIVIQSH